MFNLGIDVAKAKLDCALRLPNGKHRNKVVENNHKGFAALSEWLLKHDAGNPRVCMEATGTYWKGLPNIWPDLAWWSVSSIRHR